jgi:hypothetical protein
MLIAHTPSGLAANQNSWARRTYEWWPVHHRVA